MGGKGQGFGDREMKLALGLLLFIAISTAVLAQLLDPENWTFADWTNVAIAILLGSYFFVLSQHVNSNAQERAENAQRRAVAAANATLITSTGLLAMSSARSLSGSDSSALRVAADARAALQHYLTAGVEAKKDLRKSVVDAYIDLAFSTFSHSDTLARSVWTRLCEGSAKVAQEARELASRVPDSSKESDLSSVADHVGFVELLGHALRENAEPDLAVQGRRRLSAVWDATKLPYSRPLPAPRTQEDETVYRLERFEELYKYELTVMHDWEVLRRNAEKLDCDIEIADIAATGEWLAPWYVGPGPSGQEGPVNVLCGDLDERARYDELQVDDSTPRWPNALRHGELPHGMRTVGIDNLCRVLETQSSPTICVLSYELCVDERSGRNQRLVLDGNHRLAAARSLSLGRNYCSGGEGPSRRFRVLTFLIREQRPVDDLATAPEPNMKPDQWRGFTPDIGLVRGTWRPDEPREEGSAVVGETSGEAG